MISRDLLFINVFIFDDITNLDSFTMDAPGLCIHDATNLYVMIPLQVDVAVVGSSLLSVLDRLAFEVLLETSTITSGNISKINQ